MRALAAAALVCCTGCLFPFAGLSRQRVLTTEAGQFELSARPGDLGDLARAAAAIERGSLPQRRWGKLARPVTFHLLPSHLRLESAVGRFGFDWLHAWARYDEVYLQAPSSWGPSDAELDELVLHELTHCVMYQRSAGPGDWTQKQIPLWFREGMATWTANQGYKWPALEDLARFYEQHPEADPLRRPEPLYQDRSEVVYAAAHHAFTFLVRRRGEEDVRRLMAAMSAGGTFPQAFEAVVGITAAAFEAEFRHYLVWRGFRGHGGQKPSLFR